MWILLLDVKDFPGDMQSATVYSSPLPPPIFHLIILFESLLQASLGEDVVSERIDFTFLELPV